MKCKFHAQYTFSARLGTRVLLAYSEITIQQWYFEGNRRLTTNNGIPNTRKVTKISYFQFKRKDASSSMNMQTYIKTCVTVDINTYEIVGIYIYIWGPR